MVGLWKEYGRIVEGAAVSGDALFHTVAKDDLLRLYPGGSPDYQRVVSLLDFKKKDVAKASQISIQSVRYDHKMPKELEERLREWATALSLVAQYFGNEHKTVLWFKTENPLLGNIAPRDVIRIGRFKKLYRFILNALLENAPSATR